MGRQQRAVLLPARRWAASGCCAATPTIASSRLGAWTVEVEQRIRFLQLHLFNVVSDWRVDPFVAVGQVYDNFDLFSHVRVTGGIGLRAWVHPNVLGRVDLAVSDDGFHAYVVLGYPF